MKHTQASQRYYEMRMNGHTMQVWCTMLLANELRKRYPHARLPSMMLTTAVSNASRV